MVGGYFDRNEKYYALDYQEYVGTWIAVFVCIPVIVSAGSLLVFEYNGWLTGPMGWIAGILSPYIIAVWLAAMVLLANVLYNRKS